MTNSANAFQAWSQTEDFEDWINELKKGVDELTLTKEKRPMLNFIDWALSATKESRKEQRIC